MIQNVKWVLAAAFLISSVGCSTLNPFKSNEPEDLNALTYGDQYRSDRVQSPWTSNATNDDANRTVASTQAAGKDADSPYYNSGKPEEALDPTNEGVRQQIEVNRGLAVNSYQRGDRATRGDFYDKSAGDGSLWSNENDANYFFTKGKVRTGGDIISIKMEEPILRQLAEEIKKSLSPAEQEVEMALYTKNSALAKNDQDLSAYRNIASDDLKSSEAEAVKIRMEKSVRWSQVDLSKAIGVAPNEELRAEIIDRYPNGNYKIRAVKRVLYRGSSKMMSLVAVAPAADFDEKDLITSGKLYEYKIRVAK
jgi:flagellar basal body L-ring protein FlgH